MNLVRSIMFALPPAVRFAIALLACALTLGACSTEMSADDTVGGGPLPTKDAPEVSESDGDPSEEDGSADASTDVTMPTPEDDQDGDSSSTTPDEAPPASPPGTINELEDIIENQSDEMVGSRTAETLVDRFVVALLADSDGLDISEADARCAGETLEAELSATSFELLVTNVETQDELDNGNQFTDAELLVISESLASCLDLRPLVEQVVEEDPDLEGLTTCIARSLDVDAVESLILFEILGDNGERLVSPLILTGLELCPTETRIVIDNTILSEFLIADAGKVEACLAEISTAELRPFFETREFSELITQLRQQCLF